MRAQSRPRNDTGENRTGSVLFLYAEDRKRSMGRRIGREGRA